jgi:nucleoside-diphosphate-sugar epimerase
MDDLIEGLIRLMRSGHPGPMNLGNTEEITVLGLAQRVRAAAGSDSPIAFDALPEDDPRRRRPDGPPTR